MRQRVRGGLIMAGVLGMFVVGVLVGGVDVIDRRNDPLWFVPQALIGPLAIAVDSVNLIFVTSGKIGMPSIGRVNELGTLLTALAGLLNFAAMIDAATRDPRRDMDRRDPSRIDRRAQPAEIRPTAEGTAPPRGSHDGAAEGAGR
jgi:hypothetical protein